MKTLFCTKNGVSVSDSKLRSFLDPSKCNGIGVYESIQTYHGRPFRLRRHLKRLEKSAVLSGLALPVPLTQIDTWCREVIHSVAEDNQFVKIVITPDDVIIASRSIETSDDMVSGACAITYPGYRKNALVKSLDIRHSYRARALAKSYGCYEALLFDESGYCTEGAFSNLFWVKNGNIFSTKYHALPGITQEALIECIEDDYRFNLDKIRVFELFECDEIFVSSSYAVVPIISVNQRNIGNGKIGQTTSDVLELFSHLIEKECSA